MRGEAMKNIVSWIKSKNISLGDMSALEFFAREGDWQTVEYCHEVKSLDAWEIDSQFKAALLRNLPNANITIGDSYELAKIKENHEKFNFIVIDYSGTNNTAPEASR